MNIHRIDDCIMRKGTSASKLTEFEIKRNNSISKLRYIIEQVSELARLGSFGIAHLDYHGHKTRFTTIAKKTIWICG